MPFDRAAYPGDWPAISLRIRDRAGWRCEACGVPGGAVVTRIRGRSEFWLADAASGWFDGQGAPVAWEAAGQLAFTEGGMAHAAP